MVKGEPCYSWRGLFMYWHIRVTLANVIVYPYKIKFFAPAVIFEYFDK